MKTKSFIVGFLILANTLSHAATNDLTSTLQRGLFEEEANRNLDAAAQAYQAVSTQFDKDRALAATAIFRLGEIYRKQNKTNQAAAQYERIVREFSDQDTLVTLSRQNLVGLQGLEKASPSRPADSSFRDRSPFESMRAELALLKAQLEQGRKETNLWVVARLFSIPGTEVGLFGVGNPAQLQGMLAYQDRRIRSLESALAQSQNENQDSGSKFATNTELLTKLKALSRSELRDVLPSISGDQVLTELIQQLNIAEAKFRELARDVSEAHPDYQRSVAVQKLLNEKIDARMDGIIKAMELRGFVTESSVRGTKPDSTITAVLDDEEAEIRRIQEMIRNSPDLINAQAGDPNLTPLARAASKGQLRVATFLLEHGADVQRNSPLSQAAGGGHKAMVELLLKYGASFKATDGNYRTALHRAADRGFLSVTETLLSAKADPNARDATDRTPLTLAVEGRFIPVAAALLMRGADPNIVCRARQGWANDRTSAGAPLHLAVTAGNEAMVALLLTNRADITLQNPFQESPLAIATLLNNTNIARQLIAAGADVNGAGINGGSLLFTAAINNHRDVTSLLLEHGANPNCVASNPREGTTPLMTSAQYLNSEIAAMLLSHKADPNLLDAAGYTALHYAAGGSTDNAAQIVRMILSAGAKPNAIDLTGASPLHWAARSGRKDSMELLINAGAELNLRDNSGKTPLDLAKERLSNSRSPYQAIPVARPTSVQSIETNPSDLITALRQHGALENLPMLDRIEVRRGDYSAVVFWKGTNDWNHFTLLELIGVEYGILASQRDARQLGYSSTTLTPWIVKNERGLVSPLSFPNLAHVTILRPSPDGKSRKTMSIDVNAILNSGDCTKDVTLNWGDVVEIPEQDHPVSETWPGFSIEALNTLTKCLARKLTVSVRDQTLPLSLFPSIYLENGKLVSLANNRSFTLLRVLDESKALRSSSDLSRVKVTRRLPASDKQQTWVVDCSGNRFPDLWVRDGDVIEVPDK